jgi:hypothetical protein
VANVAGVQVHVGYEASRNKYCLALSLHTYIGDWNAGGHCEHKSILL